MSPVIAVILVIVALVLGLLIGYIYRKNVGEKIIGSAEQRARNLILDAEKKSETIEKEITLEAKEEAHRLRNDVDREIKERRNELNRSERRLAQKEEAVDRKLESIEKKEENITRTQQEIAAKKKEIDSFLDRKIVELEKISGMTADEAKQILLEEIEKDVRHDASVMIKEIESKAKEEADSKAKNIIVGAIQRCAADQVAESTVSVVPLPNDEMKGRIIGREGRNIRAIETQTGVDLIIDDTPEAVIISGFDPVRREIARVALEKLITDGRIHPARIEEMVNKAEKEVNGIIKEEGERATFEAGIHNLHPELIKLLGRLKYRTSYGQNVLNHSLEVSHLAGLMAGELGMNVKLARRAGLLHDIGKALDHEYEGTHVDIGVSVLKKYKESEAVINAVAAHHGDYEPKSSEAVLVAAADALSAARPGARRETLDVYIKRLEKLEEIANTTPGVEKSFAIQAGREIRIIANPNEVGDDSIALLAREISKKIESELEYPGQIKVNVVRETRAVDYAK
ncbi:MAG: ribonuclease Y [Eubacterium sp.]|nr:ribonuclease Y [Eubacterium sp.]